MKKRLTLGSLFDGIGGFPLVAVISGITPLWAAEIEPFCIAVTKQRFPDMKHLGSVRDINGADIPPVDVITFGSPCQDLSVAGQRAGLDGERSGLFREAIRIIYEMRWATHGKYPTFIVWENVPGAFSSSKGRDFQTVLKEITKTDIPMPRSGKWANAGVVRGSGITAAWRLLDAQYWGVPQRRKRIYLVGSFGSDCAEEILFERDSVRRYLTPCGAEREKASARTQNSIEATDRIFDARGNGGEDIAPAIIGDHCGHINDYAAIVLKKAAGFIDRASVEAGTIGYKEEKFPTQNDHIRGDTPIIEQNVFCLQGNGIDRAETAGCNGKGWSENIGYTLNTIDRHAVVYALDRASFNQGINARYDFEISDQGVNSTVVAKGPSAVAYEMLYRLKWIVRRLTPLECERLQGYPDFWTCIRQKEDFDEAEHAFWRDVYISSKKMNGKKYKSDINVKQLVKWYNKLESDASRYKALGNSLAIPCALRVIGGIAQRENYLD